jgi:hypothetical protein
MKVLRTSIVFLFLFLVFAFTVSAQEVEMPRSRDITSDDFAKKRPARKSAGGKAKAKSRYRKRYKSAGKTKRRPRRGKRTRRKQPVRPEVKPNAKPLEVQVGVTMWKLRPQKKGETGPFMRVKVAGAGNGMWTPERVGANTVFKEGDRVRLAVESSAAGYLYIFDSEIYSDGTIGDPYLIFPESPDKDNRVGAGILVDIPDQSEQYPYFLMETKRRDYAGEALLVVIVAKPLKNLEIEASGRVKNIDEIEEIEEYADAEIYNGIEGVGSVLTRSENDAACGTKMRSLPSRNNNSVSPCGLAGRFLTRESPVPQTIYKASYLPGKPVAFPLAIKLSNK